MMARSRSGLSVVLAATTLVLAGCMTFEVEGGGQLLPRSVHGKEVVHGSLYAGSHWGSRSVEKCDDGNGLFRVEYHTNALFVLASVATLGIYVPQSVEWWCQAPDEDDSSEEILTPSDEF